MASVNNYILLYQYGIKIPKNIKEGTVVIDAIKDGSAERAGIRRGDIITKINGRKTKDTAYLRYELYQHQAGDTIELTILRGNKEKTVKVKLAAE